MGAAGTPEEALLRQQAAAAALDAFRAAEARKRDALAWAEHLAAFSSAGTVPALAAWASTQYHPRTQERFTAYRVPASAAPAGSLGWGAPAEPRLRCRRSPATAPSL